MAKAELMPPPEAPTKAELAAADRRWNQQVECFQKKEHEIIHGVLVFYWSTGEFLNELIEKPTHYGNRTVEKFADAIGKDPSMIYAYHRFFKAYKRDRVEWLANNKVAWHNVFYLLSVKDEEKREELEQKVADKEITVAELQDEVKSANKEDKEKKKAAGAKVDKRGGTTPAKVFKSVCNACIDMTTRIDEFVENANELKDIKDDERRSELEEARNEVISSLKTIRDKINGVVGTEGDVKPVAARKRGD